MYQAIVTGFIFATGLLWAVPAHPAVIATNEWVDTTGLGWSYVSGLCGCGAVIDNVTNSPSGGGALRFTYNAGTYPQSVSGGRAEYTFSGKTDLYFGHWMKWSSPWDWHPIGTKIDYLTTTNPDVSGSFRDNFLILVKPSGQGLLFTQQLQQPPGTQNRQMNRGSIAFQLNRWYWLEYHARMNTVGKADGLFELWIDDTLIMQHNDVTFRTNNNTWGSAQHSPIWGGNGPATINQQQFFWVGHTVISTTRIGHPAVGGDTTPPRSPADFTAY